MRETTADCWPVKDLSSGLLDTARHLGRRIRRTANERKRTGRDHNPYGFTMWMAVGGIKRERLGATDESALRGRERPHARIHATSGVLGIDHECLTYRTTGGRALYDHER